MDPIDLEEANKALQKAKISLMSKKDSTFFTTVCFSLKHSWDKSISTAGTDGKEVVYNPTFFMKLSPEQRVFLLLHETMHVAYLHMNRLKDRDKKKWNIAADHVINLMLIERGYKMIEGGYADPQYTGLNTEEVYKLLPDPQHEDFEMDLKESDMSPEDLSESVEEILVRAAVQSKMNNDSPGSIPGDIQIFINGLLNPKLPWQRILQKYIQQLAKDNYSFKKPNKRYFPKYILPSLYSHKVIDLAIAVDTSGSVTNEEFHQFISEITTIFKMMKPEKISLVQFDTTIKSVTSITKIADIKNTKFVGKGGTLIHPVINWAKENKPQLLLVFTDGDFYIPPYKENIQTIWLVHNNKQFTAPFGKVIHYEVKQ